MQLSDHAEEVVRLAEEGRACESGVLRFLYMSTMGRTVAEWVNAYAGDAEWLAYYVCLDSIPDFRDELCKHCVVTVLWQDGQRHCADGPAVQWVSGKQEWRQRGQLHREDGPAVIYVDGTREWYRYGKLHREDGPAVEYPCGTQAWYRHGKRESQGCNGM